MSGALRKKIGTAILANTLALATLGACAPAESASDAYEINGSYDPESPETWPFAQIIGDVTTRAEARGDAALEQLDMLAEAAERGEVTYGDMHAATVSTASCLTERGAIVGPISDYYPRGMRYPYFTYSLPPGADDETFDALFDACDTLYLSYLREVYSYQPSSRQALFDALTTRKEQALACLESMGGEDLGDATIAELWAALKDQGIGGEAAGYSQQVICMYEIGLEF